VPAGKSRVALALTLEPGWHVYWVYAGDSGEPPALEWSAPTGFSIGPMQYPVRSRLPLGPLMDYGYEGTAVFPFYLSTSSQIPLGNAGFKAHVRWLAWRRREKVDAYVESCAFTKQPSIVLRTQCKAGVQIDRTARGLADTRRLRRSDNESDFILRGASPV
jgi:hypothetical protein